jgi:hypothetical protein
MRRNEQEEGRNIMNHPRTMKLSVAALTVFGALAGCATLPDGPSVAVMPAPGKPFEVFMAEDNECRAFAKNAIGGKSANEAATESELKSAAVGTAIGAAAGALMGGKDSAGTGAGVGMLSGAAMGSAASEYSGNQVQRRYDIAYEQCMYAKGNQLPTASAYRPRQYSAPQPAPSYSAPPPPPAPSYNAPPPPPQGNIPPPPPPQ